MSRPNPAPTLRILDPEAAEQVARNRQAWAQLWKAIAREPDATDEAPPDLQTRPLVTRDRPALAGGHRAITGVGL
jgi:hypothetical protein